MTRKKILVVDDEIAICSVLADHLESVGYETELVHDGKIALQRASECFDLAVLDLSLPGANGLEILQAIKSHHPDTPVIIMTAYASMQTAIKALKQGAYDFITKPFDLDEIQVLVERALERNRLIDENRYLLNELKSRYNFDNVIGHSRDVQEAYLMAARVADSNASVLILGETGTGKEFLARAIHYQSSRAESPFIKVNCAAIPEALLESEFFGYEKGAFTSAVARRIGRFEMADGGTIFLDEIGDITPAMQVKLLRVLQEKQFERVGSSETIQVDVRVVAATNRDLQGAMKNGSFREDLYYRLNVIPIKLPPLRERPDDVPRLVDHFLLKYRQETGKRITGISDAAMGLLKHHPWRGNIRELENCIERAVILANSQIIQPQDLLLNGKSQSIPAAVEPAPAYGTDLPLREVERLHITAVLESCGWNQSRAAGILGIDRKTLRTKIREYGLGGGDSEEPCP